MSDENQKQPPKWEWRTRFPEIMREVFSEKLPETELEALRRLLNEARLLRRAMVNIVGQLEEIRHDLRVIRIES